ncbi:hypothetical protein CEXT_432651 [Caerostris extrusa]|uniref:Uncharacterized protein n=1 Tax=Caerostris extrusa TaxID=172846 RepID=A0AAV4N3T9_CAEEX|nr:hypothetical protein CEXT_432651 [Caerostris extrusa]
MSGLKEGGSRKRRGTGVIVVINRGASRPRGELKKMMTNRPNRCYTRFLLSFEGMPRRGPSIPFRQRSFHRQMPRSISISIDERHARFINGLSSRQDALADAERNHSAVKRLVVQLGRGARLSNLCGVGTN